MKIKLIASQRKPKKASSSAKAGFLGVFNDFVFRLDKESHNSDNEPVFYWKCEQPHCIARLVTDETDEVKKETNGHFHSPQQMKVMLFLFIYFLA